MRIEVTRSGGFAGITRRVVADPAPAHIESLAREAQATPVAGADAKPDAFEYEVTIDGRRTVVHDARGAWGSLIDAVMAIDS